MQKRARDEAAQVEVLARGDEETIFCCYYCPPPQGLQAGAADHLCGGGHNHAMERDGKEAGGGGVFFRDVVNADHPRRWKPTSSTQSSTSTPRQHNSHAEKNTGERNGEEGGIGVVFFKTNSTQGNRANQAAGLHTYGPREG
uniref:Uncharacterized protein n=1 Tax=Oryza punctata TaxID=4537 RepID=A0A0E0JZ45_ORYPU